MVTRRHSPQSAEPEEKGQTDREFKDRSAELGVSFDEFYKKFKPSLNAILAKARRSFSETPGNDIEAEWQSAADEADDIAAPVITAHAVGALNKDQSLS